jgi:hypothetical protein
MVSHKIYLSLSWEHAAAAVLLSPYLNSYTSIFLSIVFHTCVSIKETPSAIEENITLLLELKTLGFVVVKIFTGRIGCTE